MRGAKQIGGIYETSNYSLFKFSPVNRKIKPNPKLINSIKKHGFISVVICNRKMIVIDGQHRIKAAEKLGVPVVFAVFDHDVVVPFVAEIQCGKAWAIRDYIKAYKRHSNQNYVRFDSFLKRFKMRPSYLLALAFNSSSTTELKEGTLQFSQAMSSSIGKIATRIAELRGARYGAFDKQFNNTKIAKCLKDLISHSKYNHEHFLGQLNSGKFDTHIYSINGSYEDGINMLLKVYNADIANLKTINGGDFLDGEPIKSIAA